MVLNHGRVFPWRNTKNPFHVFVAEGIRTPDLSDVPIRITHTASLKKSGQLEEPYTIRLYVVPEWLNIP